MIIFLGIAGAGKGTQAELLAKHFGSTPLSSGEVLRRHKDNPKIQKAMAQGVLVSDEILLPIMEEEILKAGGGGDHLVLDGFPRNLEQARWLMKKVEAGEFHLSGIINLQLSAEKARARLLGRSRSDDNQKAIDQRFEEYRKNVMPIINYFKDQGFRVSDIDGDQTVEQVFEDIKKNIE